MKDPKAAADLLLWLTTDSGNQAEDPGYPACRAAAETWSRKVAADPFYASDVTPASRGAAELVNPDHVGLRFELSDAFAKVATDQIKQGNSLEAVLPQLQQEIVSAARAARYKVVAP